MANPNYSTRTPLGQPTTTCMEEEEKKTDRPGENERERERENSAREHTSFTR